MNTLVGDAVGALVGAVGDAVGYTVSPATVGCRAGAPQFAPWSGSSPAPPGGGSAWGGDDFTGNSVVRPTPPYLRYCWSRCPGVLLEPLNTAAEYKYIYKREAHIHTYVEAKVPSLKHIYEHSMRTPNPRLRTTALS